MSLLRSPVSIPGWCVPLSRASRRASGRFEPLNASTKGDLETSSKDSLSARALRLQEGSSSSPVAGPGGSTRRRSSEGELQPAISSRSKRSISRRPPAHGEAQAGAKGSYTALDTASDSGAQYNFYSNSQLDPHGTDLSGASVDSAGYFTAMPDQQPSALAEWPPGNFGPPSAPPPPPPLPPAGSVMTGWELAGGQPRMNAVYRLIRKKELQHQYRSDAPEDRPHQGQRPRGPPEITHPHARRRAVPRIQPSPAAGLTSSSQRNSKADAALDGHGRGDLASQARGRSVNTHANRSSIAGGMDGPHGDDGYLVSGPAPKRRSQGHHRNQGGGQDRYSHRPVMADPDGASFSHGSEASLSSWADAPAPLEPTGHPAVDRVVRIRQIQLQRRQRALSGNEQGAGRRQSEGARSGASGERGTANLSRERAAHSGSSGLTPSGAQGSLGYSPGDDPIQVTFVDPGADSDRHKSIQGGTIADGVMGSLDNEAGSSGSSNLLLEALMSDLSRMNPVYRMIRKHELLQRHPEASGGSSNTTASPMASVDPWFGEDFADVMLGGVMPDASMPSSSSGALQDGGRDVLGQGGPPPTARLPSYPSKRASAPLGRLGTGSSQQQLSNGSGEHAADMELYTDDDEDIEQDWLNAEEQQLGSGSNPVLRLIRKKQLQRRLRQRGRLLPPAVPAADAAALEANLSSHGTSRDWQAAGVVGGTEASQDVDSVDTSWEIGPGDTVGRRATLNPVYRLIRKKVLQHKRATRTPEGAKPSSPSVSPVPVSPPGRPPTSWGPFFDLVSEPPMGVPMQLAEALDPMASAFGPGLPGFGDEERIQIDISLEPEHDTGVANMLARDYSASPWRGSVPNVGGGPPPPPPLVSDGLASVMVGDRSRFNHVYRLIRKKELQIRRRGAMQQEAMQQQQLDNEQPRTWPLGSEGIVSMPLWDSGGSVTGSNAESRAALQAGAAVSGQLQQQPAPLLYPFEVDGMDELSGAARAGVGGSGNPVLSGWRTARLLGAQTVGETYEEEDEEWYTDVYGDARGEFWSSDVEQWDDAGVEESLDAASGSPSPVEAASAATALVPEGLPTPAVIEVSVNASAAPQGGENQDGKARAKRRGRPQSVGVGPFEEGGLATTAAPPMGAQSAPKGLRPAALGKGEDSASRARRRRIQELKASLRAKLLLAMGAGPSTPAPPQGRRSPELAARAANPAPLPDSTILQAARRKSGTKHSTSVGGPTAIGDGSSRTRGTAAVPVPTRAPGDGVRKPTGVAWPSPTPAPGLMHFLLDADTADWSQPALGASPQQPTKESVRVHGDQPFDSAGPRRSGSGNVAGGASPGRAGRRVREEKFGGIGQLWRAAGIEVGPLPSRRGGAVGAGRPPSVESVLEREGVSARAAEAIAGSAVVLTRGWAPGEVLARLRGLQAVLVGAGDAEEAGRRGKGGAGSGGKKHAAARSGGLAAGTAAASRQPNLLTRESGALEGNLAALGAALGLDRARTQALVSQWPSLLELRAGTLEERLAALAAELGMGMGAGSEADEASARPAMQMGRHGASRHGQESSTQAAPGRAQGTHNKRVTVQPDKSTARSGLACPQGGMAQQQTHATAREDGALAAASALVRRYPPALALTRGSVAERVASLAAALYRSMAAEDQHAGSAVHLMVDASTGTADGGPGPAEERRLGAAVARAQALLCAHPGLLGCSPVTLAGRWRMLAAAVAGAAAAGGPATAAAGNWSRQLHAGPPAAVARCMAASEARLTRLAFLAEGAAGLGDAAVMGAAAGLRRRGRPRKEPEAAVGGGRVERVGEEQGQAGEQRQQQQAAGDCMSPASAGVGAAAGVRRRGRPRKQPEAGSGAAGAEGRVEGAGDGPGQQQQQQASGACMSLSTALTLSAQRFAEMYPGYESWLARQSTGRGVAAVGEQRRSAGLDGRRGAAAEGGPVRGARVGMAVGR